MTDAFIYDHLRSPRGRGKVDGSLHEVSTVNLASQVLKGVRERNNLDAELVDDVVMGCVDPIGEAGGDVARISALLARLWRSCARYPDQPLLRFGARCGEFRRGRGDVAASTT